MNVYFSLAAKDDLHKAREQTEKNIINIPSHIKKNLPHSISIPYYSGTKSKIDLKPGSKFKFICHQKVYVKKIPIWTMEGP